MASGEVLVITGWIDGRSVGATWCDGTVIGDEVLIRGAETVAASGLMVEQDSDVYTASLHTLQGAAIALMRALDDIESVRISAPAEAPSPLSLGGN
jgi:hypothetical protein